MHANGGGLARAPLRVAAKRNWQFGARRVSSIQMSTLFLGSDPRTLADKLADELDRQAKAGDFFVPATIVAM